MYPCRVFFLLLIRVLMFYKNWHIFYAIHVILRYSCLRVVFIFLFVSCRVFCRVLVIFSCRVKFVFVSCSYHVAVSCPKLPVLCLHIRDAPFVFMQMMDNQIWYLNKDFHWKGFGMNILSHQDLTFGIFFRKTAFPEDLDPSK